MSTITPVSRPACEAGRQPIPVLAILSIILIWGYSWVVTKIGLAHAHPFDFGAVRVGLGGVLLFAVVALQGRSLRLPSYRIAAVLGLLQVALFLALSQFALLEAGAGRVSVLIFTMPFWMIVFAQLILHERMRGAQWVAVALAFGGLVLVIRPWELTSLVGSLLAVAAGAVWALGSVLSKKWPVAAADPLLFAAWQLLFGFVALGVLALSHPHPSIQWTGEFLWTLAFSTVFGTATGWWLWTYVLARTPAGITGLNALGVPVVAVIASAIQLGERPPAVEIGGMVLIGSALALLAGLGLRKPAQVLQANPVD